MHAVGLEESASHAERTFVKVTPRVPACLPAHTRMGPPVHTYLYTYPATRTCIRAQPYTPTWLPTCTYLYTYPPVHRQFFLLHRPMKTSLRTRVWKSLASSPSPLPCVGVFLHSAGGPAVLECRQGGLQRSTLSCFCLPGALPTEPKSTSVTRLHSTPAVACGAGPLRAAPQRSPAAPVTAGSGASATSRGMTRVGRVPCRRLARPA